MITKYEIVLPILAAVVCCSAFMQANGNKTMSGHSRNVQTVFDLAQLNRQQAESGGPWLEFLNVPSLYCGVYHLAAGSRDSQAPHAEDEVYYVETGKSKFHLNGDEFDVRPGMVLYVPARKVHYFHEITEDLNLLVFFSRAPVANTD